MLCLACLALPAWIRLELDGGRIDRQPGVAASTGLAERCLEGWVQGIVPSGYCPIPKERPMSRPDQPTTPDPVNPTPTPTPNPDTDTDSDVDAEKA